LYYLTKPTSFVRILNLPDLHWSGPAFQVIARLQAYNRAVILDYIPRRAADNKKFPSAKKNPEAAEAKQFARARACGYTFRAKVTNAGVYASYKTDRFRLQPQLHVLFLQGQGGRNRLGQTADER